MKARLPILSLFLALSLMAQLAAGSPDTTKPEKTSFIDEQKSKVRALESEAEKARADTRRNPATAEKYKHLVEEVRSLWEARYSLAEAQDAAELEKMWEQAEEEIRAIIKEWVTRAPDDPDARLAQIDGEQNPRESEGMLRQFISRWPDRVEGVEKLATLQMLKGEEKDAIDLMERFRAEHPDGVAIYPGLWRLLNRLDYESKANEVLRQWRERFPDDPGGLEAELSARGDDLSSDEVKSLSTWLLAHPTPDTNYYTVCETLLERKLFAEAAECYQLAEKVEYEGESDDWFHTEMHAGLLRALVGLEDWDRVTSLLDVPMEGDQRMRIVFAAAHEMAEAGQCARALALIESLDKPGNDTIDAGMLADVYRGCGEAAKADDVLLKQIASADSAGLHSTVSALIGSDRIDDLGGALRKRMAVSPDDVSLFFYYQMYLDETEDTAAQIANLRTWASADPKSSQPLAQLGALLIDQDQPDLAIQAYSNAIKRSATDYWSYQALIGLYLDAARPDEAKRVAEQLLSQKSSGESWIEGHRLLARIAKHEGDLDEALRQYESYYSKQDQRYAPTPERAYLEIFRDRGDLPGLEKVLSEFHEKGLEARGGSRSREEFFAGSYEEIELYGPALRYLEAAIGKAHGSARLEARKAHILEEIGDLKRAEESYRRVLTLDPGDTEETQNLADVLMKQRSFGEAIEVLRPIAAKDDPRSHGANLLLGRAYLGLGKPLDALPVLNRAFDRNTENYRVLYEIGRAYLQLGQPDIAAAYFERFLVETDEYDVEDGADCGCYCDVIEMRRALRDGSLHSP